MELVTVMAFVLRVVPVLVILVTMVLRVNNALRVIPDILAAFRLVMSRIVSMERVFLLERVSVIFNGLDRLVTLVIPTLDTMEQIAMFIVKQAVHVWDMVLVIAMVFAVVVAIFKERAVTLV